MALAASKAEGKHSLKKDAAYVYVGHFLRYLSPLILVPYYSRVLGPEGYGLVLTAISLMTLISAIVCYGFNFSGVRELASADGPHEYGTILGRQLLGRYLLIPVGLLVGVAGTISSPLLIANYWYGVCATLLGIVTAFSFSWFFQGLRQFKKSILVETMAYPINVALVLSLVRNPNDGLFALISLLLSNLIAIGVAYVFVRREAVPVFGSFKDGLREIRDTTIFFITGMSFTIITIGSTFILSIMSSPTEVGYFGTAERVISLATTVLNPISQVLMPSIARHHKQGSGHAVVLMRKGILFETTYGIAALAFGYLLAPYVLPLILGSKFIPSIPIFRAMLVILPFVAVKHALILYLLIPTKEEKYYLWTSVLNVIVNLISAVALVPFMGALGMASARAIAEISATVFLIFVLHRRGISAVLFKKTA